jgi:Zn-dependent protease with chaperone function
MKRLRANTLKDHCNFLLHFGLTAGVAAGAVVALGCPPILGAISIGAAVGSHFITGRDRKRLFQAAMDEEKGNSSDRVIVNKRSLERGHHTRPPPLWASRIQQWADGFASRLGMDPTPDIIILDHVDTANRSFRTALKKVLNETANAYAFDHTHGSVVLTAPIVEELNTRELKGVLGHEIGHLAANHTAKREALSFVSSATKILTTLNMLVTAYSGFRNAGVFLFGSAMGFMLADKLAGKIGLSEDDPDDKKTIKTLRRVFAVAAVGGAGVAFGAPDLALAAGIQLATSTALNLINKRYSRRMEFQADRISADLTGDPQGLGIGLERVMEKHRPESSQEDTEHTEKKILSGWFGRVADLNSKHPNVYRRCARLAQMEQRAEYVYA